MAANKPAPAVVAANRFERVEPPDCLRTADGDSVRSRIDENGANRETSQTRAIEDEMSGIGSEQTMAQVPACKASLLVATLSVAILQNLLASRDPQLAILYVLAVLSIALLGGGRFSLDARFFSCRRAATSASAANSLKTA